MGRPTSLLRGARAFARDFARDQMPPGYLWDVVDYVPTLIDASLTGRGSWLWGSGAFMGDIESGILATFTSGEQLLVQDSAGELFSTDQASPFDAIYRGQIVRAVQNPIQYLDTVIWFDGSGAAVPQLVTSAGAPTNMDASAPKAKVGTIWNDYVLCGGNPAMSDALYWSKPGQPAAAWDPNSIARTNLPVTGIATLRSVIIVFHAASTERIRGSIPPATNQQDDLTRESLFARVGTPDPKSIAYWNENVIFADEHGVHITDGAVVRNLVQQGGISYYWRPLYQNRVTLASCVFLDYYIITVRRSDGIADTLIADLNRRQWFRFSNIPALSYISSGGSTGMERVWAGIAGTSRLARIGPTFFPDLTQPSMVDDNGVPVLPKLETPWYRFGPEGLKRVRFFYVSYDVRAPTLARGLPGEGRRAAEWREPLEAGGEGAVATVPALARSALAAVAPILDVGYIRSPQLLSYTSVGGLPPTVEYDRKRLPIGQAPYGLGFRIQQLSPSSVTRLFDIAIEAMPIETSQLR